MGDNEGKSRERNYLNFLNHVSKETQCWIFQIVFIPRLNYSYEGTQEGLIVQSLQK